MAESWRTEVDALDHFGAERKRVALEQRRPVVRRASDLVGPGIGASAVRVTDWSDTLASFNGYYSSLPGAANAPNAVESFTGFTVMDDTIGGSQTVTGAASGTIYRRLFTRNPGDASSIAFGVWNAQDPAKVSQAGRVLCTFNGQFSDLKFVVFDKPYPAGTIPVVTLTVVGEDPRVIVACDQTTSGNPHLSFGVRMYYVPSALSGVNVYVNWESRYATQF